MTNDRIHKIAVWWPDFGGSGGGGRMALVACLVLLTHYRYPEMSSETWLNFLVGIFAGLGLAGGPPSVESKP